MRVWNHNVRDDYSKSGVKFSFSEISIQLNLNTDGQRWKDFLGNVFPEILRQHVRSIEKEKEADAN
jgi:hypothetical protein